MGCVPSKNLMYSPTRELQELKHRNGYLPGKEPAAKLFRKEGDNRRVLVLTTGPSVGGGGGHGKGDDGGGSVGGGEAKVVSQEGEKKVAGNVSQQNDFKKIGGGEDLVEGWPKWLVANIPKEVLSGLIPKSADSYDMLSKVGQGTYSNVYKARDRDTGKIVALKKVRFDTSESESVKFMAREIMILQKLDHPNIIKLVGIATSRMQYSLYLVLDYMQTDLTKIISRPGVRLTEPQVKYYMKQLLSGLQHCHERGILHRDIKASNLLIDKHGVLKIADFGLGNFFLRKPKRPLTNRVVTLWYRAPELILGSTDYGVGIDLWSAGCLLAEMFIGRPIMPGRTEVEQLHRIFKLCGSPQDDYWKIMRLPASFRPPQHYKPSFQELFKDFSESSFNLLTTLLDLIPANRGTATSALQSQFFSTHPLACGLSDLPVIAKEEEEQPMQANGKKKRRSSKKLSSQVKEDSETKTKAAQKPKANIVLTKKEKYIDLDFSLNFKPNSIDQDVASSSSVNFKRINREKAQSPSPVMIQTNKNRSVSTEAHPNASKNIQNFTLLEATVKDMLKHNGGNGMPSYRRSLSTLDFRTLDAEGISKLFGLDKD